MHEGNRAELYRSFNDLVLNETQTERALVNKRMLSVFIWCFLMPAGLSLAGLFLIQLNIVPYRFRTYVDALILIFPVAYAVYYLSTEVLREMPRAFRRGGVANVLNQFGREVDWRLRVCDSMKRTLGASREDWAWIVRNFKIDLDALKYRNRYLTALAGAVFFLIMQGIDSIQGVGDAELTLRHHFRHVGIDNSWPDPLQYLGLGLFLVLLYLSGSQTHQYLSRFLGCVELVANESERVGS